MLCKLWISVWCISMKCFRIMSSGNLNSASRGKITGSPWKMLSVWPFKVEKMELPVTLIWTRPSPQRVQTARRNKTLMGCAIRPPKEDNIMHTRAPKCDEAFSVQTYQIWTNQYVMKNYIMLLIMREWFCLNTLWKVKSSYEKKFLRKRKAVL